ncbi:putative lipid II flippase FtsW [Parasporobacterium paucivorans]|uniref:putative lipid II flippase FtsW n=1 Tax=Parasporobacterium paucivorans TaxID=115544 RepID=UPI000939182D
MALKSGKKKNKNYFDYSLLFIVIFLLCFGLVMLYSTSSYNAQIKTGSSFFYLIKQAKATFLGLVVMLVIARIDYHFWKRIAIPAYFISMLAILLVLTPLGIESNGARRWIGIAGQSIQPAEIAKLALILFFAYIISKNPGQIRKFSNLVKVLLLSVPVVALIAGVTSNLSSAIIILGIAIVMLFVASPKYSHFVAMGLAAFAGMGLFVLLESYRLDRIKVWLNPEKYSLEGGYQVLQGLYAIGSGGLFGKGLGQSLQKLGFVPEAQNDMIFTIICEELGLFGAVCVILMFLFMLWRFMIIANNAPDLFGSLLVVGIMAHISLQVILNIAVVTNSIPNTGITLPFISYGGTSILFLLGEMGLALSVSRSIQSE